MQSDPSSERHRTRVAHLSEALADAGHPRDPAYMQAVRAPGARMQGKRNCLRG